MTKHNDMLARLREKVTEARAYRDVQIATGVTGEQLEEAEWQVAKWERRLKWEEEGDYTIEAVARRTAIDIRDLIENIPPVETIEGFKAVEEWRAFMTESCVRLENLLRQRPLRHSALADELKRFSGLAKHYQTRFEKLARE
jgi:hypothetical protein